MADHPTNPPSRQLVYEAIWNCLHADTRVPEMVDRLSRLYCGLEEPGNWSVLDQFSALLADAVHEKLSQCSTPKADPQCHSTQPPSSMPEEK